jgi:hypothetical protein
MELQKGQRVVLKSPGRIEAIVDSEIYGDLSVPEDERTYHVTIPETRKRYQAKNLEPIPEEQEIHPHTPAHDEELARFVAAGQYMLLHPGESVARNTFIESGRKLGWIISLPQKP